MKKLIYISLVFLLSSCGANYHLKKSEQHRRKAIELGAKVSSDTVYVTRNIPVTIPGDSAEFDFGAVIDLETFQSVSDSNDSLVREIQALRGSIEPNAMELAKANRELSKVKARLSKGFTKDSIYVFRPDTLTTVKVQVSQGVPVKVLYDQKERVVTRTVYVPVKVETELKPKNRYFEWFVGGILIGWVICFAVWVLAKRRG